MCGSHVLPGAAGRWPGAQPSPGRESGRCPHLTGSCAPQTTYKGKSSFQTYSDYLRWESFLQQQLQTFPEGSALRRGFQTCEHWKQIFMEIIGKRQPSPLSPASPGLEERVLAGWVERWPASCLPSWRGPALEARGWVLVRPRERAGWL